MNRPLFRAVIAFALGEVTYVAAGGISRAGIVLAMSAFCVFIYLMCRVMHKRPRAVWLWLLVPYLLGGFNIYCDSKNPKVQECMEKETADEELTEDEPGEADDGATAEAAMLEGLDISTYETCGGNVAVAAYGVIKDITNTENSRFIVIKIYSTECAEHIHNDSFNAAFYDADMELCVGDELVISGTLNQLEGASNPGAFDKENYYETKSIEYLLTVDAVMEAETGDLKKGSESYFSEVTMLSPDEPYFDISLYDRATSFLRRTTYKLREYLSEGLGTILSDDTYGIYKGILLGDKSNITAEQKELYKRAGISHVLAISSLHITLVAGMLLMLLKRCGLSVYIASVSSFGLVFLYCVMTGFGIAGVRALIMMLLGIIAAISGRDYDILTSLGVALLVVLVAEPSRITDSAGVLSFSAIIGVAVSAYIIKNLKKNKSMKEYAKKHRLIWNVISALVAQCSLQLVMLPVTVSIYYEIYPYSFFVNLLVVPLMTFVVGFGFFGIGVLLLSQAVGGALLPLVKAAFLPGECILRLYDKICRLVIRLPYNSINVGKVSCGEIIVYYIFLGLLLLTFNVKINRRIRECLYKRCKAFESNELWSRVVLSLRIGVLVLCLSCVLLIHWALKNEVIAFLDVGQGAGALVRTYSGCSIVIDGGSTSESKVGQYTLLPAIKYYGMSDIDYWFVSHADEDHVSGLTEVLSNMQLWGVRIKRLVFSNEAEASDKQNALIELALENGIEIVYVSAGDKICGEDFEICCVHPEEGYAVSDINDASMALSFVSDRCSALFTGDMGTKALECMLDNDCEYLSEMYDILQVPHHGSKNSLEAELYSIAKIAVISCGENNSYGHPHEVVMEALTEAGVSIYRTDKTGALVITGK